MLRHGVNSHHAFAMLIRLAQASGSDIATAAERLLDECAHQPEADDTEPALRWISAVAESHREVLDREQPTEALDVIIDVAARATGADLGLIVARHAEDPERLEVVAARGLPTARLPETLPNVEPWTAVVTDGTPTTCHGGLGLSGTTPPAAAVLVPFLAPTGVPGALAVGSRRNGHAWPAPGDLQLLTAFARQASAALTRAQTARHRSDHRFLADDDRRAADVRALATKHLFGIGLLLQGSLRLAGRPELHRRLQKGIDEIDRAIDELRESVRGTAE